ncbi:glycosyltransferase family 4 protein [bacterium]|nr:glycosyltransferase family 4 protein [candidate division CSSED10-310 bacterium]
MARIAVVDLIFNWPPNGGSMVDVYETCNRLQGMGHEVKLFVPGFESMFPRGRILGDPGFEFERIPFNRLSFNYRTAPRRFRAAVDRFRPDEVFLTDGFMMRPHIARALWAYPQVWRSFSYEILCARNSLVDTRLDYTCPNHLFRDQQRCVQCFKDHIGFKKTFIKLALNLPYRRGALFMFHEFWFAMAHKPEFVKLFEQCLRRARAIVVLNNLQKSIYDEYNDKVIVCPIGVNEIFQPRPRPPRADGKKVILMTGRANDPVKGYEILLRACRLLWKKRQDFELQVTLVDFNEWRRIPFLKRLGWYTQEQLPELYAQADIVCMPSYWEEAFGIVAVEAMASGKPIVACRVAGPLDTVVPGVTGVLVRPRDPYDLYRKLNVLLDHPNLCRRMGEAGIERVNEYYRWGGIMQRCYRPLFGGNSVGSNGDKELV